MPASSSYTTGVQVRGYIRYDFTYADELTYAKLAPTSGSGGIVPNADPATNGAKELPDITAIDPITRTCLLYTSPSPRD